MFVARTAEQDDVEIPMDETIGALRKALPKDHPVIAQVERCFKLACEVIEDWDAEEEGEPRPDPFPALNDLVRFTDDWRAGIRDWDEVEPHLDEARRVADWA